MSKFRSGFARPVVRRTSGLVLGGASAFVELGFLLASGPAWAVPATRPQVLSMAHGLAERERRRIEKYFGPTNAEEYTDRQALRYLRVRWLVGGLGAGILLLVVLGALTALFLAQRLVSEGPNLGWHAPITSVLFGAVLVFVTVQGLIGVVDLDLATARRMLGRSTQDLRRRVSELTVSRSELVEAVNHERRRIERDLHDGIQQQLVVLGMVLGQAARTVGSERGSELVRQAHDEAGRALAELREVSWRVYPVALDAEGLHEVLRTLAERSTVTMRLRYELTERCPSTVEVPAYFVISEAVANACKHAGATQIDVEVTRVGKMVVVRISDDGRGGADPAGSGLSGLRRRVAAGDGVFTVESPAGGPTVITATLPCG